MKKSENLRSSLLLAALALTVAGAASAASHRYKLNQVHSTVLFAVDHLGYSKTHGVFRELDAQLVLDEDKIENSTVQVVIQAKSIDTGVAERDNDLRGKDWLDVAQYPEIRFVSTRIEKQEGKALAIRGNLTLHGQTRPITLMATFNKSAPEPFQQKPTVGFSADATLQRSDFGIKPYLPVIGDTVAFTIDAEFDRPK